MFKLLVSAALLFPAASHADGFDPVVTLGGPHGQKRVIVNCPWEEMVVARPAANSPAVTLECAAKSEFGENVEIRPYQ